MVAEQFQNRFAVKYTRWILRNRFLVLAITILGAIGLGSGGRFIEFSNNYRVFFGKDNPQLIAFEEVENTYTKSDNVLFVLAPKDKNVFTGRNLEAVQWLTKKSWQMPYSTRVDSLTNFQHTRAEGDDLFVDDLVQENASSIQPTVLKSIRDTALNEPILLNRLIREKSDVTGVSISIQMPEKHSHEVLEVSAFARKLEAEFQKEFPEFDTYLSGMVMMNNAFAEMGQRDAMTLTPIMYLIMIFVMALLLRSFGSTLAALGVILLSTVATMGLAGYLGFKLTPPSAIAPTIILTLAIADSVHILVSMLILMRKGWEKAEALVESLRINLQAVFLTSLTTAVGFLSLNFSDSPPYHDLGNITAMGVTLAFLYSITFLPAMVSIIPIRVKASESKAGTFFDGLAGVVIARHKTVLVTSTFIVIGLASFIPKIELNDFFVRWFDHRVDFRNDTDFTTDNLTGIYQFDYSISSGEPEGVSHPKFMKTVKEFAEWWEEQPEVMHVITYTDIMKKINKSMHGDDQKWYKLPDDFELAAQYLLLYEMSLPFGLDLNNQIDIDKSAIKLTPVLKRLSSRDARELATRGDKWLRDNAPKVMHATATGPSIMFSHISLRNLQSMIKGTFIAFALITLILIISLRSLPIGLLSLIPNVLPALMALGVWSILYTQVGMAISIVSAATLGIIVDDTVHFLTKYLRARREQNKSAAEAVRYAFSTVGLAILTTSVILGIGFSVLAYSSFRLNWSLGILSTITIIFAMVMDFTLLPAALLIFDKDKKVTANESIRKTA